MFVQLYMPGYGWWSIEPAYTTEDGRHDMLLVWGDRYSKEYDETEAYWVREFSSYIR